MDAYVSLVINRSPISVPIRHHRLRNALLFRVEYSSYADHIWRAFREHRARLRDISTPASPLLEADTGYMDWYITHSHSFIINPFQHELLIHRDRAQFDAERVAQLCTAL